MGGQLALLIILETQVLILRPEDRAEFKDTFLIIFSASLFLIISVNHSYKNTPIITASYIGK
ncbi:MAG: hypothetical protein M0R77_10525 [Gammaproteobacteria bacterium]|nr:hypothetical protein [Gammaproteobacteria bacterium]